MTNQVSLASAVMANGQSYVEIDFHFASMRISTIFFIFRKNFVRLEIHFLTSTAAQNPVVHSGPNQTIVVIFEGMVADNLG